jgi:hypothetical protein
MFDAEAERLSIEVRGLSREDLVALIESSTFEIPTTEHRRLHQEASDFVRWGRRGGWRTLALYNRPPVMECFAERFRGHRYGRLSTALVNADRVAGHMENCCLAGLSFSTDSRGRCGRYLPGTLPNGLSSLSVYPPSAGAIPRCT